MTRLQMWEVRNLLKNLSSGTVVSDFNHGDCMGADAQAHDIARDIGGFYIKVHPPRNHRRRAFKMGDRTYPEADYLTRNAHIVTECDILIACPGGFEEELRSGTWATVRKARSRKRSVYIIWPNGEVTHETSQ